MPSLPAVDVATTGHGPTEIGVAFRLESVDPADVPALDVLAAALAGGPQSRLALSPLAIAGDVGNVRAYAYVGRDVGLLVISCTVQGGNLLSAARSAANAALLVPRVPLTDAEVGSAREAVLAADAREASSMDGAVRALGQHAVVQGDPEAAARRQPALSSLTVGQLRGVAREHLTADRMAVAVVVPQPCHADASAVPCATGELGEPHVDADRLRSEILQEVRALTRASPPRSEELGEGVWRAHLPDGGIVLVRPEPLASGVAVVAGCSAGAAWQAEERSGGAVVLGALLAGADQERRWSVARPARALASHVDHDVITVEGEFVPELSAAGIRTVITTLLWPAFGAEEFMQARAHLATKAARRRDQPDGVAWAEMRATLHRGQPYSLDPAGTVNVLDVLDLEQIESLHQRVVRRESLVVSIVGPVDPDAAIGAVADVLAAGPPAPAPAALASTAPSDRGSGPVVRRRDLATDRSHVMLGYPTDGLRGTYHARAALAAMLDSGPQGVGRRLEGAGLAYRAGVERAEFFSSGRIVLHAEVPPGNEEQALESLRSAVATLRAGRISDAELARARSLAASRLASGVATPARRAAAMLRGELAGLPATAMLSAARRVVSITREQVLREARQVFDSTGEVVVIVGPRVEEDVRAADSDGRSPGPPP
jgi:predicted Zn-dependent peptidase